MLVKTKMRKNGTCPKGARHVKNRKGCWRERKHSMSGRKGKSSLGSKKRR